MSNSHEDWEVDECWNLNGTTNIENLSKHHTYSDGLNQERTLNSNYY